MLGSEDEVTITDVVRSMKRIGFTYEDIYDTLTGAGLSGEEIQLLHDRIEKDFEDAKIKPRAFRLSLELEKMLDNKLKDLTIELNSKIRKMDKKLKIVNNSLTILEERILELQEFVFEKKQK